MVLGDPIADLLGVPLGVRLLVALREGLRKLSRLRPRNVSWSMALSGELPPPPASAASQSSTDSRTPLV